MRRLTTVALAAGPGRALTRGAAPILLVFSCAAPPHVAAWRASLTDARRECAAGNGKSCARAASFYRDGGLGRLDREGWDIDLASAHAKSAELSARACELGLELGCNDYGVEAYEGLGIPMDRARAVGVFVDVCLRGEAMGCLNVAQASVDGLVPNELAAPAFVVLASACRTHDHGRLLPIEFSLGHPHVSFCLLAGNMQLGGRGVPKDERKARDLFAAEGSNEGAWLARSPDGGECTYGCRGASDHSSSCVLGRCSPDVPPGGDCSAGHAPCAARAFCELGTHTCVLRKKIGEPCSYSHECASDTCAVTCRLPPPVYIQSK